MDSTVEAMAAAYDALVDAAAAAVREPGRSAALTDLHRCLDAFSDSCDRAEGLVQAAAAGLGPAAARHDALCRAVRAVDKDLRAAGGGQEENEMDQEKNRPPTTPLAAEDN
ncbi:hypothetical protein CFC21_087463 [Triticum aestivum]|uniref:Pectinesterase inhibitor domain-containing protein n=2 Tax=Triticum aestivum TaxID=4565 RepID=A0A9R1IGM9_WHEAT|nr:hypothetical protein CFC21_087463 [Triticum aestivum]